MADQSTTETRSAADGLGLDYPKIEAMVSQLANAISQTKTPPGSGDGPITLRADYQITMEVVKLLSDIRFRCLVFVTAIITIATALLPGTGDSGTRIILGFVGFLATLGITVYELRNSQLYEAACHRAKMIEGRLGMEKFSKYGNQGGLFGERPKYTKRWKDLSSEEQTNLNTGKDVPLMSFWLVPVKHDHGLACIYGAALGGWVYLIANGLLSLAPPGNMWPPAPAGWPRIISAVIAFLAFLISAGRFVYHDRVRFRPEPPEKTSDQIGDDGGH